MSTVASLAFVGGSHSGETGARISTLLQVTSGNLFDTYRTGKGVRIEFVKEQLTFTGEDSPMASLLLSVMGAFRI